MENVSNVDVDFLEISWNITRDPTIPGPVNPSLYDLGEEEIYLKLSEKFPEKLKEGEIPVGSARHYEILLNPQLWM